MVLVRRHEELEVGCAEGSAEFMTVPGDRSFLRFSAADMAVFAEAVAVRHRVFRQGQAATPDVGRRNTWRQTGVYEELLGHG
ncbi:hypothetical protein Asi02nite_75530 [Asanoa siamensis]|uniref:Uncharacterized protein n=1 Tax=Asanoa siamensis TaxID=926357 RepID=A0ABQ4D3C3_9ACTN|nr:hypothetical protein Asi02nite_75530 [Asanoa siamensis]